MTETKLMNSPMIHITKLQITILMKVTISLIGHQEHAQQLEIRWSTESIKNGYHKNIVTLKFLIPQVQELKILIMISCQSSKNKPDYLILHVGTYDATTNSSRKIVNNLLMLRTNISKQLANCKIVLSKPTIRHDHGKANLTIQNVNRIIMHF